MARRFRERRASQDEEPTVNLTPLIDVVFVILILFILVAPILEINHIELAEGRSDSQEVSLKETSHISLHVLSDNQLILNSEKIPFKELKPKLLALKAHHPTCTPQIYLDKKAYFGTYQQIKNCLEDSGFETMDLVLKP